MRRPGRFRPRWKSDSTPYRLASTIDAIATPQPNPATVEVLLDTTWRVAAAETARTDALDRKASTLATFSSLLTSLTATFGFRFVETTDSVWALAASCLGLAVLVVSVALAVLALLPTEYLTLGTAYLRRLPTWAEIMKPPEQVRGETMRGLVEAVGRERRVNDRKTEIVRKALLALLLGLVLIAAEAGILAAASVQ